MRLVIRRVFVLAALVAALIILPSVALAQAGGTTTTPGAAALANTAAQIVGLAGLVFGVLQGLKKLFPNLVTGKVAIGTNIALSLLGAVAEVQGDPQQILSISFLLKLGLIALSAAGIHDALRRAPTNGVTP